MPGGELLVRNLPFRRFFAARACSFLGDGVAMVALVLLVHGDTGSGVAVGALLLAQSLPRLLGPFTGALADRWAARRVMVGCDLGQAAIYVAIALAQPPLGWLLVLVALATALQTLFSPAGGAALPRLVEPDDLLAANARFGAAFNVQIALGPLLGGVLVAAVGTDGALAVNAASFLASAALLVGVPQLSVRVGSVDGGVWSATWEGLAYVRRDPVVRALALALFAGLAFGAMDNVALVFLAREELGAGPAGFGALTAAYGVGMVAGSLWLARTRRPLRPEGLFLAGLATAGAGIVLVGLAPVLVAAVAFQALAGVGNGASNIAHDTVLQRRVPEALRGRALGIVLTAAFAGAGLASVAGGVLLEFVSPRTVFVIAGAGTLAACALAARPLLARSGEDAVVSR
jgi:MFS family permease